MKKKKEWSKIITTIVAVTCALIAIWCIFEYYDLCKLAIINNYVNMPDATLPVTSITCLLGSILSYLTYQGALKTSLNKNKLSMNSVSGVISAIQSHDMAEIASTICTNAEEETYEEPVHVKGE